MTEMSAHVVGGRSTHRAAEERTAASVWHAISGGSISDELLEWPPDLFALANTILAQTEAFRFCLSPVREWPPSRYPDWAREVEDAGREWGTWVEDRQRAVPGCLIEEWSAFCERADAPLDDWLTEGRDWRMCEALLTLHAIADEACAGLGVALDRSDAEGCVYRARGRELLVRTGSLARILPTVLRVLPKVCTPPTGKAAFSRYACVQGPGMEARWHKMPTRHRGTDPQSEHAKMLLLPWPLEVRESDFRALEGSVRRLDREPYGFYKFQPAERLDFDLLDRVLVAARREARSVDVVFLPESAVDEEEIEELEALLDSHGVVFVHAGVRGRARQPGRLPRKLAAQRREPEAPEGRHPVRRAGRTMVSHPPAQAPPMVAGRSADLSVPPGWRASSAHPLVGGDRRSAPGDRVHRGRRAHGRFSGLRGPCSERRDRRTHTIGRPDGGQRDPPGRTSAQLALGGEVRERASRRSGLGRANADLLRHGAALPTTPARGLAGDCAVEGRRQGVP